MKAPFPYYGGKRRWAASVWSRLGDPRCYIEPFAGSLAILLHRETACRREIVCDTDGMICNFWRSVQADPDAVAHHADWPTIHQDLTARHKRLVEWKRDSAARLSEDAEWHDVRMAGWWVWGMSLWIGGNFCTSWYRTRPRIERTGGGAGISQQAMVEVKDQVPSVPDQLGGRGVSAQRNARIRDVMRRLQDRLKGVVVLNRDWRAAVQPTLLMDTPTCPEPDTAVVMDPPYLLGDRKATLYQSDRDGTSSDAAREAWEWAVENGERHKVVYFGHAGDFETPDGWECLTRSFGGVRRRDRNRKVDAAWFSPKCRQRQRRLL